LVRLQEDSLPEKKNSAPGKIVAFVALVFVVGVAGVFAGNMLREYFSASKSSMVTARVPRSLLKQGMVMPDAELVGIDSRAHRTSELLGDNGGVVLFLDLECPPCIDMALKWQDALDNNMIMPERVWGISYHTAEVIRAFMDENNLRFAIFTDSTHTFLKEYEVSRFPLEVIVGSSGKVRSLNYDSESPIDFAHVDELLSN
jgi:peroxiredoxin